MRLKTSDLVKAVEDGKIVLAPNGTKCDCLGSLLSWHIVIHTSPNSFTIVEPKKKLYAYAYEVNRYFYKDICFTTEENRVPKDTIRLPQLDQEV